MVLEKPKKIQKLTKPISELIPELALKYGRGIWFLESKHYWEFGCLFDLFAELSNFMGVNEQIFNALVSYDIKKQAIVIVGNRPNKYRLHTVELKTLKERINYDHGERSELFQRFCLVSTDLFTKPHDSSEFLVSHLQLRMIGQQIIGHSKVQNDPLQKENIKTATDRFHTRLNLFIEWYSKQQAT